MRVGSSAKVSIKKSKRLDKIMIASKFVEKYILIMSLFSELVNSRIICIARPFLANSNAENHIQEDDVSSQNLANRVFLFVKSLIKEAASLATITVLRAGETIQGTPCEYVIPKAENNNWKKENKGLYVAIHGLRSHPSIWHKQLSALRKLQPEFEIRLPYVPERGNCKLQDAVIPIEAMIRDYIQEYPNNPICLIGVSNGARIAIELEIRLRDTKTPIKVSCIAGALCGTKQMNLLDRLGLAGRVYSIPLVNELSYQSRTAIQLMERMREPLTNEVLRSYDFYATPNDFQIRPYTGSFPLLNNENVRYYLVPGENHNSIVSSISTLQVKNSIEWMSALNYRSS